MISSEDKSWSTPVFIVAILTILFGLLYYSSSRFYVQPPQQARQEFDYAGRPAQKVTISDRLLLTKNKKIVVGRNGLVFKGVDKNEIIIDLYLLDMDPEQAYEKRYIKKEAKKGLSLGGGRYRLISVNDKILTLKRIKSTSIP